MRIDVEWNQLESLKVKHPIIPFSTRISLHSESRIYVDWVFLYCMNASSFDGDLHL